MQCLKCVCLISKFAFTVVGGSSFRMQAHCCSASIRQGQNFGHDISRVHVPCSASFAPFPGRYCTAPPCCFPTHCAVRGLRTSADASMTDSTDDSTTRREKERPSASLMLSRPQLSLMSTKETSISVSLVPQKIVCRLLKHRVDC